MRIAIIAYEAISPFMLSTPIAVFGEPFADGDHRVEVCADRPDVATQGGLMVRIPNGLDAASAADLLILPGWRDADELVPDPIVQVIRAAVERGALVAGLCLGAFGLAQAGVLDDRRATTHWACVPAFAQRFPRVQVDPGAIFVDGGPVVTSAGMAAGLDCCLHLLARISGQAEANRVARRMVVAPQRGGGHPQLIERPTPATLTEHRVADLLDRLRVDPVGVPPFEVLARQAGTSPRSLGRHIRARTGDNLGGWLRRSRLMRAQALLAEGNPIELTATQSGFPDGQALRAAFRRELGMTPRQWMMRQRIG
ncbi:GlxA family transcriptional regulator [Castellaniella sp.]|uniref:GlxA family transcriptional regulator n=1 Tax=Castellaniella sp. TaxID=1955812 RepID=UPI002AFF4735|nr:helix-turn-helix domain-containing protein [Castellaniella sp.]